MTEILSAVNVIAMKGIVLGGIFLLVAITGGFYLLKREDKTPRISPTPVSSPSLTPQVQGRFDAVLPPNGEKTQLKDVSGGDSLGVVNRIEEGNATILIVYADLPELKEGEKYQAWQQKGDKRESLGILYEAKGGWLLEKTITNENMEKLIISRERNEDSTVEQVILEASFK